MRLAEFIRFNKQKGISYSIAVHIFLTIMVSFNFDITMNAHPPKQLVYMDIVENAVEAAPESQPTTVDATGELPAQEVSQNKEPASEATQEQTEPLTEGQTKQTDDPNAEVILWVCGIATPRGEERRGFSGEWVRKCEVPPEEYFKDWNITRAGMLGAIVGEGSIKVNGNLQFERDHKNANCDKGNFDNRAITPPFGQTYELEISKCDMSDCAASKCWAIITFYGKTKEGKSRPPPLNSWKQAMQENPKGPVYLLEPHTSRKVASSPDCTLEQGPNQCSRIMSPGGGNFKARVAGSRCEDFGGYTSLDACTENHKPYGCEGGQLGNEPQTFLCWKGMGPPRNLGKMPAFALWQKLGWFQNSKVCEEIGGYHDQTSCQANSNPNSPCIESEFTSGMKCWQHTGEPLNAERSPAHVVWKKLGF